MRKTLATLALAGLLGGCAVAREQQTVGQYVDDTTITSQVKAKFADDGAVAATAISVETMKGLVQLSGFAKSWAERCAGWRNPGRPDRADRPHTIARSIVFAAVSVT